MRLDPLMLVTRSRSLLGLVVFALAAGCVGQSDDGPRVSGDDAAPAAAGTVGVAHGPARPVVSTVPRDRLTYSTNFGLSEPAISEHGVWLTGVDPMQTPVATAGGVVFGTQTGLESAAQNFNDSAAWLSGTFPPNQRVSTVIHKVPGLSGGYQEVEILLRWSVGPLRKGLRYGETHSHGYEINLAWDGQYVLISPFKQEALFDSLVSGSPITALGVQDGDVFAAEIVGNTITATLDVADQKLYLGSATDNSAAPITSGAPGIGFFRGTTPGSTTNPTSFAFSSFTATALP